jgi:hypothetical protein
MKIRIAAIALLLASAAACSQDVTAPHAPATRVHRDGTTFAPDTTPLLDDGGGMMGSGTRTLP